MNNLRIAFTILLLSAFVAPTFAGDTKLGGIRAGWHYADIYSDGSSSGDPLSTFYIGFYKNNKIAPIVNWTSGIEYFQNGSFISDDTKTILHTISIPLALKLKIGPFFALGGAGANFMISEKSKVAGVELNSGANFFDVPLFLGAGFNILMFSIEARYHWGMLDIYDTGGRNQYLQIGGSVEF